MTVYQEKGKPDVEAERRRIEAIHNTYPSLPFPTPFNESGLVPYPCEHGIAVKPKRFAATKGGTVWRDEDGNERPPYGGRSWGRARYLTTLKTGMRNGVASAVAYCVICNGEPEPADFYTAADGTELR